MLGGLDWTGTALGRAFKSQEQVLFLFAGIIFIISVTLHMLSIPERHFSSLNRRTDTGGESTSQLSLKPLGNTPPLLDVIAEEDIYAEAPCREEKESAPGEEEMDFLAVDRVRSKSDSVLAMPDATIKLDPDLDIEPHVFLPDTQFLPEMHGDLADAFKPCDYSTDFSPPPGEPPSLTGGISDLEPANPLLPEQKDSSNGQPSLPLTSSATEDPHLRQVRPAVIFTAGIYV